jgi:hypothetical protein
LPDDLDAAAGVVHQVLWNERFAQRLDAGFVDQTMGRIAIQPVEFG